MLPSMLSPRDHRRLLKIVCVTGLHLPSTIYARSVAHMIHGRFYCVLLTAQAQCLSDRSTLFTCLLLLYQATGRFFMDHPLLNHIIQCSSGRCWFLPIFLRTSYRSPCDEMCSKDFSGPILQVEESSWNVAELSCSVLWAEISLGAVWKTISPSVDSFWLHCTCVGCFGKCTATAWAHAEQSWPHHASREGWVPIWWPPHRYACHACPSTLAEAV